MDFRKMIYENIEKKHSFHNNISIYIYIYESQTFYSFIHILYKFYFVHIVKAFSVFKNQSLCLYSRVYA